MSFTGKDGEWSETVASAYATSTFLLGEYNSAIIYLPTYDTIGGLKASRTYRLAGGHRYKIVWMIQEAVWDLVEYTL